MPGNVVFISYSHDSDEHREKVLGLAERLRQDGLDARLDQYVKGTPEQGWPRWMLDQLDAASFVLVVCTETYYRRFRGHEVPGRGKGVDWEGALITQEIYEARSRTAKFVPVLLSAGQESFIPEPLYQHTHYTLTSAGPYQALYEFLLGQGGVEPGPIGPIKPVSQRVTQPLAFIATSELAPPVDRSMVQLQEPETYAATSRTLGKGPLDRLFRRRFLLYMGAVVLVLVLTFLAFRSRGGVPGPHYEVPILTAVRGGRTPAGDVLITLTFDSANLPPQSHLRIEIGQSKNFEEAIDTQEVTDWQGGRVTLQLDERRSSGYVRLHFFDARGIHLAKSTEKYFQL